MIKKRIEQILLLHFYSHFKDRQHLDDMIDAIAGAVKSEVEDAIKTAINVRFNGIPQ